MSPGQERGLWVWKTFSESLFFTVSVTWNLLPTILKIGKDLKYRKKLKAETSGQNLCDSPPRLPPSAHSWEWWVSEGTWRAIEDPEGPFHSPLWPPALPRGLPLTSTEDPVTRMARPLPFLWTSCSNRSQPYLHPSPVLLEVDSRAQIYNIMERAHMV